MIGLDTNILVRFLVQDDPMQSAAARSLLARCSVRDPAFVGREALIETVWILESAYGLAPARVAPVILGLLEAEEIVVEAA
ncbi:MAG: type II toxin-antitoxin system VapC family toxin, partial [Alphaproteobacteria bacterium]|nr:type II toxin-antitoxin system VapC family toxin [Alphaproteobacteria bacterium]